MAMGTAGSMMGFEFFLQLRHDWAWTASSWPNPVTGKRSWKHGSAHVGPFFLAW